MSCISSRLFIFCEVHMVCVNYNILEHGGSYLWQGVLVADLSCLSGGFGLDPFSSILVTFPNSRKICMTCYPKLVKGALFQKLGEHRNTVGANGRTHIHYLLLVSLSYPPLHQGYVSGPTFQANTYSTNYFEDCRGGHNKTVPQFHCAKDTNPHSSSENDPPNQYLTWKPPCSPKRPKLLNISDSNKPTLLNTKPWYLHSVYESLFL